MKVGSAKKKKRLKKNFMITYNVAKCGRKQWGVYVRAISGDDLKSLVPTTVEKVVRVTSGRLARKRSKQSAKNFIERLKQLSSEEQRRLLQKVWIKKAPRDYKIVKVQNLRLFREHEGQMIPLFSTINRTYAEKIALYYAEERGVQSFLRKTTTSHLKLPLNTDTSNLNKC